MSDEIRIPSGSRNKLVRCCCAGGDPGMQNTVVQESFAGPEMSTIYGVK